MIKAKSFKITYNLNHFSLYIFIILVLKSLETKKYWKIISSFILINKNKMFILLTSFEIFL